jgi:hypothetical protein
MKFIAMRSDRLWSKREVAIDAAVEVAAGQGESAEAVPADPVFVGPTRDHPRVD